MQQEGISNLDQNQNLNKTLKKTEKPIPEELSKDGSVFYEEGPIKVNISIKKPLIKEKNENFSGEENKIEKSIQEGQKMEKINKNLEIFEDKEIKKWVEKFLPEQVLDQYALTYETSKRKTNEQKRQNKKYKKYYKKAEEVFKPQLMEFFKKEIESKALNLENLNQIEVERIIAQILRSDMRTGRLFDAMKENCNKNNNNFENKDSINKDEVISSNQKVKKNKNLESETENTEKPQTEIDFNLNQINRTYLKPQDGSEFRILDYDAENKKIKISFYQGPTFNKETEAWSESSRRAEEKTISLEDFKDLTEDFVLEDDDQIEIGTRKNKTEKIQKKEEIEKKQGRDEQMSSMENKVFQIFKKELENYQKEIKKVVQKDSAIPDKDKELIIKVGFQDYLDKNLTQRVGQKIQQYQISGVDEDKILEFLKKEFLY